MASAWRTVCILCVCLCERERERVQLGAHVCLSVLHRFREVVGGGIKRRAERFI